MQWIELFERYSRRRLIGIICGIVVWVAIADYETGYELSFSFFYLGAIALATWCIGWRFALFISVASVALGFAGDLLAGASGRSLLLAGWNGALALAFYLVTVAILSALRSLQLRLEEMVRVRTGALTREMAKRELLEKEILEVSEREQRRIGHDLHDSLCQHLTATAIAGEVLRGRLEAKAQPEAGDARRVVALVEEGIALARSLARGLAPIELEEEGLMAALREMSSTTSERFHIDCRFECPDPVVVHEMAAAGHLFRIAQEAITNAIKHGRARTVTVRLATGPGVLRLSIRDDGAGLPASIAESRGMGMHIMRHRAQMIGGEIEIRPGQPGTIVECTLRKEEDLLPLHP
jgi:signal transduction histidine kinase